MGALVFADPDARRRLEAIIHPLVHRRSAELEAAAPEHAVVVHDIPLLAEGGRAGSFDAVVVVDAPAELQVRADGRATGAGPARTPSPASPRRRPARSGSRSPPTSSTTRLARRPAPASRRSTRSCAAGLTFPDRGGRAGNLPCVFSIRPRLAVIATGVLLVSGCAGLGQTPDDAEPATSSPSSSASAPGSETPAEPEAEATETRTPPRRGARRPASSSRRRPASPGGAPEQLAGRASSSDASTARTRQEPAAHGAGPAPRRRLGDQRQRRSTRRRCGRRRRRSADAVPRTAATSLAVIGVDQEGGYVSHLRGIATDFPALPVGGAADRGRRPVSAAG